MQCMEFIGCDKAILARDQGLIVRSVDISDGMLQALTAKIQNTLDYTLST